jgi:hypothetical protein
MMNTMRFVAGLLFLTASARASTSISGPIQVTPTQALIPVVTDQIGACTYRVSENDTFLPLVNDVNPALFAGSNVDSREGSLIQGQQHAFVLGKRSAESALDGRLYSRALQANTMHWVIALQNTSTGVVTSVVDGITTYPLRFWGDHGLEVYNGKLATTGNILGNKGVGGYLTGPFIVAPTQINKSGTWNSDTSLTAAYADGCPNTIAAQWQAAGATGNNCVQIRAKQPCSANAGAHELVQFPCPWDGTKSMLSALAPGGRFWLDAACNGACNSGSPETMRVITTPTNLGGGAGIPGRRNRTVRHLV